MNPWWLQALYDDLPKRFYADIAIACAERDWRKTKPTDCKKPTRCVYHEHDDELPACGDE